MARMLELDRLLDAIEELSSPDLSLVFTNSCPGSTANLIDRHREGGDQVRPQTSSPWCSTSTSRGAQTGAGEDRRARLKIVERRPRPVADGAGHDRPGVAEDDQLDITGLTAADAAARLIAMADG